MSNAKLEVVFVLGSPGAGKGTQCKKIEEEFGYVHLSAGELLRQERAKAESPYKECIDEHCHKNNVDVWMKSDLSKKMDLAFVLFLDCPKEQCSRRILERGAAGSGREDDNLAKLDNRFRIYTNDSMPVIEHFQTLGLVKRVDACKLPLQVYQEVRRLFQNDN